MNYLVRENVLVSVWLLWVCVAENCRSVCSVDTLPNFVS